MYGTPEQSIFGHARTLQAEGLVFRLSWNRVLGTYTGRAAILAGTGP